MSFCQSCLYSFLPLHSIIFAIKYTFSHKRGAHTFNNNILTFWKHTVINVGAPTPVGGRMQPAIIQSHAPHGFILGIAIFEARSARKLGRQRAQQQRAVVLGGQLDRLLALILCHLQILDRHSLSAKSVQTHSKYTQTPIVQRGDASKQPQIDNTPTYAHQPTTVYIGVIKMAAVIIVMIRRLWIADQVVLKTF